MQRLSNKPQSDLYFANGSLGLELAYSRPWLPSDIPTDIWYDADDSSTITISTGVSQWNDKSGNSRNATQATGANQPLVISADLNGRNVLSFNGSSHKLGLTYSTPTANVTSFAVCLVNSSSGYRGIFSTTGTANTQTMILARQSTSANWGTYSSVEAPSNSNIQGQGWQILGIHRDSAGTMYRNGSTDGTFASATGQTTGHVGGITGQELNGKIAEIIVIASFITSTRRQLIEGYLAHKWGLTANLPSDHPYKTLIPTIQYATNI